MMPYEVVNDNSISQGTRGLATPDGGDYSSVEANEISMMPMPPTMGAEATEQAIVEEDHS